MNLGLASLRFATLSSLLNLNGEDIIGDLDLLPHATEGCGRLLDSFQQEIMEVCTVFIIFQEKKNSETIRGSCSILKVLDINLLVLRME